MPITKGYKQLLEEANSVVQAIEPIAAIDELGRNEIVFVDLRDPRELEREGKIPGAFHCPRGMLEFFQKLEWQEFLLGQNQDPYLLTHPLTTDRIDSVQQHVDNSPYSDAKDPPEDLAMQERMVAKLKGYIWPLTRVEQAYPASDKSVGARYARRTLMAGFTTVADLGGDNDAVFDFHAKHVRCDRDQGTAGDGRQDGVRFRRNQSAIFLDEEEVSAARFFYCAKASRKDRNDGLHSGEAPAVGTSATMRDREDADWQARNGNHHPTVKPTDLMAYLCRLVTPAGGIVLDPFMGSGSTGRAAGVEQFKFVGIEINPDYFEIACRRIDAATAQQGLEFA